MRCSEQTLANYATRGKGPVFQRYGREVVYSTTNLDDFAQALKLTTEIAKLAEQEQHHPALLTEWGRTTVTWWTHKIKGLHRNDFIMAAKTDQLYLR